MFCGLMLTGRVFGQTLPSFDFAKTADSAGWRAVHSISSLSPSTNGLAIAISGSDPYMAGPARDYPAGKTAVAARASEVRSIRQRPGVLLSIGAHGSEFRAVLRAGGVLAGNRGADAGSGARLDVALRSPGCRVARAQLARIWFEERVIYPPPAWPTPTRPGHRRQCVPPVAAANWRSGAQPRCSGRVSSQLRRANRSPPATRRRLLGYVFGNQARWMPFGNSPTPVDHLADTQQRLCCSGVNPRDNDGARLAHRTTASPQVRPTPSRWKRASARIATGNCFTCRLSRCWPVPAATAPTSPRDFSPDWNTWRTNPAVRNWT